MKTNEIRYMAIDRDGFSMGLFKAVEEIPADALKVRRMFRASYGWTINTSDGYYMVVDGQLAKV